MLCTVQTTNSIPRETTYAEINQFREWFSRRIGVNRENTLVIDTR